jgi:hypothetical protein
MNAPNRVPLALARYEERDDVAGVVRHGGGLAWAATAERIAILTTPGSGGAQPESLTATFDALLRASSPPQLSIETVGPPGNRSIVGRVSSSSAWVERPAVAGSDRLQRIALPSRLAAPGLNLAFTAALDGRGSTTPLEGLAQHTHPLQALAVRLDRRRTGIAAEIAAPLAPRIIVVALTAAGARWVFATPDRIAAELLTLALRGDQAIGPWEDRIVQRATELNLGLRLPADLELRLLPDRAESGRLATIVDRVQRRLGLPETSVHLV